MGDTIKWIKITTDIFDNRKIQQIEALENGDSFIVIWLKLLTLAGTTNDNGLIYLTEEVPYTEEMLSAAFKKPVSTIRMALNIFEKFHMIDREEDLLHVANWEKYQNIEGMKRIKDKTRERVSKHRQLKRLEQFEEMEENEGNAQVTPPVTPPVTPGNPYVTSQNKNKNKDIEIEIEEDKRDKNKSRKGLFPSKIPHKIDLVVKEYHERCSKLPKVRVLTDSRKDKIRKLLASYPIETILQVFDIANDSPFLTGDNDRGWKADLDFMLREDKFVAILEGKYTKNENARHKKKRFEPGSVRSETATEEEKREAERLIEQLKKEGKKYEF